MASQVKLTPASQVPYLKPPALTHSGQLVTGLKERLYLIFLVGLAGPYCYFKV